MTTKLNQRVMVSVPETEAKSEVEHRVETTQELSATVQPTSVIEMVESAQNDRLKALSRLMMVSLTWTMGNLSQSK